MAYLIQVDPYFSPISNEIKIFSCFSSRGCTDVIQVNLKHSHEAECRFRPVSCPHAKDAKRGCEELLSLKVNIKWLIKDDKVHSL